MFKIFNKKTNHIKAFATGQTFDLEAVPDEVFANKLMGEGIAIMPSTGMIVAPVDGSVMMIMEDTKHAIGIQSNDGLEILIHIGLDTIQLAGEGFEILTTKDATIKVGDPLIKFDLDNINECGLNPITMLVITNLGGHQLSRTYTKEAVEMSLTPIIEYK